MSVSGISSLLGSTSLYSITSLSSTDLSNVQSYGSGSGIPQSDSANVSSMAKQMSDFSSLGQAFQSGDLSSAQSAYASLESDLTGSGGTNSPLTTNSQLSKDLTAVSSALQSGNLSTAQNAFATLQSDLQGVLQAGHQNGGPGRGRHHGHMKQQMSDLNALDQALQSQTTISKPSLTWAPP